MSPSTATLLRVYYTHPVTATCGCCAVDRRVGVIDLDRQLPLCQDCLSVSIQAAEALRQAGLLPPDPTLIHLNP